MHATSRFFGDVLPTKAPGSQFADVAQKPGFVDVGGNMDNMFHALAAGIVDNILTRPRTNQAVLIQLMEHHGRYFPAVEINRHLITPLQKLEKRVAKPILLAQFIGDLAYTLRQIAVNELCAHPELYRVNFEQMSPAEMRQSGSKMPKNSIHAVANALNIPVTLNEIEAGKEGQKQQHCGPGATGSPHDQIVMLTQRDYYIPQVLQIKRIEDALAQTTLPSTPLESVESLDPPVAELQHSVKKADEALIAEFERNVQRMMTMAEAGEVDKKTLLDVYIENLNASFSAQASTKSVGSEHGSQQFFEDVMSNIDRPVRVPGVVHASHEQQVLKELINALARGISLGQMDEDNVYSQMEHAAPNRPSVKAM